MTLGGHFPGLARFVRFFKRGIFFTGWTGIPGETAGWKSRARAHMQSPVRLSRPDSALTRREKEVLRHIGRGETSKQIAELLNLSVYTVSNHRRHICKKLGLHSTAQLVAFAVQQALRR